jgi:hypothetical protein
MRALLLITWTMVCRENVRSRLGYSTRIVPDGAETGPDN